MFEFCSCTVAIGGDVRAIVPKPMISVPEILLLQSIHGADAVTNIKVIETHEYTDEEERDRLGRLYGDDKVIGLFNQFGDLPGTLEAARIADEMLEPVWRSQRAKKPAAKKKAATKKTRARTSGGKFVADDPATPENEAFGEG